MSKRMFAIVFLVITLFTASACRTVTEGGRFGGERGSGNVITEERQVSGFNRINFSAFGEIEITQGDEEGLEIEGEDNIVALLETKVRNDTLYISFPPNRSVNPTKGLKFTLRVKELEALENSGAGNIEVGRLESEAFELHLSGAGNIRFDDLQAQDLEVNISGAGNLDISGVADDQKVIVSGAGAYLADNLQSQAAIVNLSGFGSMTLWVEDSLEVEISGAGNIDYYGDPEVKENVSGLGRINSRGEK